MYFKIHTYKKHYQLALAHPGKFEEQISLRSIKRLYLVFLLTDQTLPDTTQRLTEKLVELIFGKLVSWYDAW